MPQSLLNGKYQIISKLATGGFGETYLAIDTHLPSGRQCVVKKLKPSVDSDPLTDWLKQRFEKEAIILEELGNNSAQIPKLYAYFSVKDDFYLVQEFIEGLTLTQKLKQLGNFTEEEVEDFLLDILPVLDYIHSRGIIHRDIKPDNIIIRKSDGKPVLLDFGIIKEKINIQQKGAKNSSVILGTPGYMSPEQALGKAVFSSDLYSLGLTAIFLLTGKEPEDFITDPHTGEIQWRNTLKNQHSQLLTILEKVINSYHKDRFVSAQEMLNALKKISTQAATKVIIDPNLYTTRSSSTQVFSTQQSNYLSIGNQKSLNKIASILVSTFAAIASIFAILYFKSQPKTEPIKNIPEQAPSPHTNLVPNPIESPSQSPNPVNSATSIPKTITSDNSAMNKHKHQTILPIVKHNPVLKKHTDQSTQKGEDNSRLW
jgi:serine/threonine-protein kinase